MKAAAWNLIHFLSDKIIVFSILFLEMSMNNNYYLEEITDRK